MLNKDELTLICKENFKIGMRCVGEEDGEKIYKVEYETVSYYVPDDCHCLYVVYNENFEDYDTEYLDLGVCKVMKHLKMLVEEEY